MATEDEKYIAMFNAGYLFEQYKPQLLESILKPGGQESEYLKALAMGKQQQARERTIEELKQVKEKRKEKRPRR